MEPPPQLQTYSVLSCVSLIYDVDMNKIKNFREHTI
jgi:hypothetical protein